MSQGWRHGQDVERPRHDPASSVPTTGARCAETRDIALPSRSTVSRLDGILARPFNKRRLSEALMGLASWTLKASRKGRRSRRPQIDIDGLPIAVAGRPPGSANVALAFMPDVVARAEQQLGDVGVIRRRGLSRRGAAKRPGRRCHAQLNADPTRAR